MRQTLAAKILSEKVGLPVRASEFVTVPVDLVLMHVHEGGSGTCHPQTAAE